MEAGIVVYEHMCTSMFMSACATGIAHLLVQFYAGGRDPNALAEAPGHSASNKHESLWTEACAPPAHAQPST